MRSGLNIRPSGISACVGIPNPINVFKRTKRLFPGKRSIKIVAGVKRTNFPPFTNLHQFMVSYRFSLRPIRQLPSVKISGETHHCLLNHKLGVIFIIGLASKQVQIFFNRALAAPQYSYENGLHKLGKDKSSHNSCL
jgi:hypothetical protein